MPRLNSIDPANAEGEVKEIYDGIKKAFGGVNNIFQGMANSPAGLNAYLGMSATLAGGGLSKIEIEIVALATSDYNGCDYCNAAHTTIAKMNGLSDDEVLAIRRGKSENEKYNTLAQFAHRVLQTKGFVEDDDIQKMRDAGYTDGNIVEVVAVIAHTTFSNFFNHVHATEVDFPAAPKL